MTECCCRQEHAAGPLGGAQDGRRVQGHHPLFRHPTQHPVPTPLHWCRLLIFLYLLPYTQHHADDLVPDVSP